MHHPTSSFRRPARLDEALRWLSEPGSVVLSGGTDFVPERWHRLRVETVVDISNISALRGIERRPDGWRIGAGTTWQEIARTNLSPAFDGLRRAARSIGGVQIQNVATLGGNLCTASPAADGIPPLLTLDALVELESTHGSRRMTLTEFVTGYRQTALAPGEMLTAVVVPDAGDDCRSSFVKLGGRSHLVISIAMVAAILSCAGDRIVDARLAVGACSPVARRLTRLESSLVGTVCREAAMRDVVQSIKLTELEPIDDVRGSAHYRQRVVPQLVIDALLASGAAA